MKSNRPRVTKPPLKTGSRHKRTVDGAQDPAAVEFGQRVVCQGCRNAETNVGGGADLKQQLEFVEKSLVIRKRIAIETNSQKRRNKDRHSIATPTRKLIVNKPTKQQTQSKTTSNNNQNAQSRSHPQHKTPIKTNSQHINNRNTAKSGCY